MTRTHSAVTGERYKTHVYPNETDDKRAARLFTYKHALTGCRMGHMVTLAGTEAHEVELARNYLSWPADRTWFVDWAKTTVQRACVLDNLSAIERTWPGVHAVRENVCDVIERLPLIGFANLDHMGFDFIAMRSVQLAIERLAPGGTLSLTCYRGREWDAPHRAVRLVLDAARDVQGLDQQRWVGICRLITRWAHELRVPLSLVGAMEYQHRYSPMSVGVWRRRTT